MKKIVNMSLIFLFCTCMFVVSFVAMFFSETGDVSGNIEYDDEYVIETDTGFLSPMNSGFITSEFGERWEKLHSGIDMSGSDIHIYAAAKGEVGEVGYDGSRGNYVYIHHIIDEKKYSTAYFHLSSMSKLSTGENVGTSTLIGYMGNTGNSYGAHLHFEILNGWYSETGYNKDNAINPRSVLNYPDVGVFWIGRER